tara:strand:+ start:2944 stop:3435 length:492 start_codon:yes stop_codon:yes gene_type:complete
MANRIKRIAKNNIVHTICGSIIVVISLLGYGMNSQPTIEEILYLQNTPTSPTANIENLYSTRIVYRSISLAGIGAGILMVIYTFTRNLMQAFTPKESQPNRNQADPISHRYTGPSHPIQTPLPKEMADEIETLDQAGNKPDSGWISEIYQHVLGDEHEPRRPQ